MNDLLVSMKSMGRAMQPYVLFLYEMVYESKPKNVLEIGFRQAQSTRTILSALKELNFGKLTTISIDIDKNKHRIPTDMLPFWDPFEADSHGDKCADFIRDKEFDIILIDGDHSYDGVSVDFHRFKHNLAKNGYILFHDINNNRCGVPDFWKEIKRESWAFEIMSLNYGSAGLGILHSINFDDKNSR